MTQDEFVKLLEKAIQVPAGSAQPATTLDTLGWDSLGELSFISLADRHLGVKVDAARVAESRTVADLLAMVSASFSP